jgi:hypothetical protein
VLDLFEQTNGESPKLAIVCVNTLTGGATCFGAGPPIQHNIDGGIGITIEGRHHQRVASSHRSNEHSP